MNILNQINKPNDIKSLPEDQLNDLAQEIREYILKAVSVNGGHLASNLGVVELTIALHRFLDFPKDRLIFDVGHQSYVHKLLTGRREELMSLRQAGGISGFPDPKESECDSFGAGHASTAISAAIGFAKARELKGTDEKIVAVVGDGSLTGGLALEALNNINIISSNMIIVLNDNERSISRNVGGFPRYLAKIRTSKGYNNTKTKVLNILKKVPGVGIPVARAIYNTKELIKGAFVQGMFFEDLGITYLGPMNGHNIEQLEEALQQASSIKGPVLLHVITKKGKGYTPAEQHPAKYHGTGAFDLKSGEPLKPETESYTDCFSKKLIKLARYDEKIVAITAAMSYGTGLYAFGKEYPDRMFDVGIAEEHAVTFAAGLAAGGLKPVVALYSTFLQRAYDQVFHDVCLQNLPVIFAIDRAGLVGNDGKTHQGVYDIGYLTSIPNLVIMSPKNGQELEQMLEYALTLNRPVAIRYPRGSVFRGLSTFNQPVKLYENEILTCGKGICLLASGVMVEKAVEISEELAAQNISSTVVNIRFLDKLDLELIEKLKQDHKLFVTIEEVIENGSYGQRLGAELAKDDHDIELMTFCLPNDFIPHGTVNQQREKYGLTVESITSAIIEKHNKTA